jgi:hypothetical protein
MTKTYLGYTPNAAGADLETRVGHLTPEMYGAKGDGATDDTAAIQAALAAAVAAGVPLRFPRRSYRCGLVTDTSALPLEIRADPGARILTTAATWLKVIAPAGGKLGVTIRAPLTLVPTSGYQAMVPLVWLEGSSLGGIIDVDIHGPRFEGQNRTFDGLWLRACFNGSVGNIFGTNCSGSRGVVYEALDFNSGNIEFGTIAMAGAAVQLQLGGAFDAATNGALLNQIILRNFKAVRSPGGAPFAQVTLTALAAAGASQLQVSLADAGVIQTALLAGKPQWAVCADVTLFGETNRIAAADPATGLLTLSVPLRTPIANATVLPIGTFGVVIGANVRGVDLYTPHFEYVGAGVVCSGPQHVHIHNAHLGAEIVEGVYCTNGAQNVKLIYPQYSKANAGQTLLRAKAQGTNAWCTLREPGGYSAGAGPAAFLVDEAPEGNNNRYLPESDSLVLRAVANNPIHNTAASRPKAAFLGEVVQYVTDGNLYVCTTYAFNPTWRPIGRMGISPNRGDASVTLTIIDFPTQRFDTALTANRTITLDTVDAWNGHRFRVVRGAAATGAFNLDVGGLKTLAAAGSWADVEYSAGTGWKLVAAGSL